MRRSSKYGAVIDAAIADYYSGGGTIEQVAERHGIPRGTFGGYVRKGDGIPLSGGRWVLDPVRRIQVWRKAA